MEPWITLIIAIVVIVFILNNFLRVVLTIIVGGILWKFYPDLVWLSIFILFGGGDSGDSSYSSNSYYGGGG